MTTSNDDINKARDEWKLDRDAWQQIYERAKDDLFFLSDDPMAQWDERDFAERISSQRPALTIDQLSQFVHQVANDIRQNTPSINIIPAKDGDEETAEIFKGLIRNIEYRSAADDVYDTAATNAVKCSIGFIRIDHDYCDDEGFEQELLIQRVINPLACWIDRNSIEADGRDAMRGTILEAITVTEFNKRYPDKAAVSFDDDKMQVKTKVEDMVVLAEVFEVVETEKKVVPDDRGNVVDYKEGGQYRVKPRTIKTRKVTRKKMSGQDILEETSFPGKYIPLVPVYGEEAWQDGVRHIFSLIRKSKQAQQMFNYWKSLETELLQKQPQAPVMVPGGSIEDYKADWLNPGKSMALRYNHVDSNGEPLPKPERLAPPQIPTGIVNAARETVDDIKATMGLYNASLGQRSNEQSGVAIARRQQEGDVATYHFGDNLTRSITQVGRILVSAIPEIYDTPRIVRIIGVEDEPKQVGINGMTTMDQERPYDLSQGKYDVKVTTGASFTTKRQETAAVLAELFKANPELMLSFGDLYFANSDFSGSQAMAERAKKLIQMQNPSLIEEDDKQPEDPRIAQLTQAIQQMQQEAQGIVQENQALKMDQKNKQTENQIKVTELGLKEVELQMKEQEAKNKFHLDNKKLDTDLATARISAKTSSPDMAMIDPDLHESGEAPVAQLIGQISMALSQQSQELGQGLQMIAASQASATEAIVNSTTMLAVAVSKPKEVVYAPDGITIIGVR